MERARHRNILADSTLLLNGLELVRPARQKRGALALTHALICLFANAPSRATRGRPYTRRHGATASGRRRSPGAKGDRDLLVVAGMFVIASAEDLDELASDYRSLDPELRYAVRSNLTVLSMMAPLDRMPDPTQQRAQVAALLRRLQSAEGEP